jgi:MoaA/NifB/PqqE/SkfB family radical SAM enzyme
MATGNPYSVTKLAHHPEQLAAFREGRMLAPVQIHLMASNNCGHGCSWCSYRLTNEDGTKTWKNSKDFDDKANIPWDLMQRTLREAREMGTKAIELTGGGEPFNYPKIEELIDLIHELGFDFGLVSHGGAITAARAVQVGSVRGWKWARISIDAADRETYMRARNVAESQWVRAWATVKNLAAERDRRNDPEIRVGVGFVVARENFSEVYRFCELAKAAGADNVRLSLRFGPEGNDYFEPTMLDVAEDQARLAAQYLQDDRFTVHDLISERRANQAASVQDYEPCYTMRMLCVIGGDAKVYSCCTLAFAPDGELGDLRKESFKDLWTRHAKANFDWFKVHQRCAVQCLYEKRNLAMIDMVNGADVAADPAQPHKNFV